MNNEPINGIIRNELMQSRRMWPLMKIMSEWRRYFHEKR